MKKLATLLAAFLLLTAGAKAQDGKGIYNKYSDNEEVSAVYISSAMFTKTITLSLPNRSTVSSALSLPKGQ